MTYESNGDKYMNNKMMLGLVATAVLLLSACASTPTELVEARDTYATVEQDPTVTKYAPVQLREAKQALERAEGEFEDEGNELSTRALSYIAGRQARLALIEAKSKKLEAEKMAKKEQLLEETDKERLKAQGAFQKERALGLLTREQLKADRAELLAARNKLDAARTSGSMTAAQLATMEAELKNAEMALKKAEADREALELELVAARDKLNKFAQVKESKSQMVITLNGSVLFKVGESTLMPIAQQRLNEVANVLKKQGDKPIVVEGHTDSQGKDQMNQELSLARANSVRNYLVSQGVATEKIRAVGMGETQPIADNSTPEGRANNRRVEIIVGSAAATTKM